jgi:hypothetical protein
MNASVSVRTCSRDEAEGVQEAFPRSAPTEQSPSGTEEHETSGYPAVRVVRQCSQIWAAVECDSALVISVGR